MVSIYTAQPWKQVERIKMKSVIMSSAATAAGLPTSQLPEAHGAQLALLLRVLTMFARMGQYVVRAYLICVLAKQENMACICNAAVGRSRTIGKP
jgi:hypothetical protein